jgi:tetratricopeptide (TPR) repeat protein
MKTLLTVAMIFGAATFAGAQDRLADQLRKGIVQEEVNQNLTKAIEAYQAIVAQFDEERKTAASALYRLAECSRKAGKRDQALAAYQRVVREFPDQAALVESSRQQLTTAFGSPGAALARRATRTAGAVASQDRPRESREREKTAFENLLVAYEQRIKAGVMSRDSKEYQQLLERVSRERPTDSLEQDRLFLEILEKELAAAQKRLEAGLISTQTYRDKETQLRILKQQYADQLAQREAGKITERNAQLMMQRMVKSVEAEIALIQERLAAIEKSAPPGTIRSQSDPELLQLRRDLLGLQRRLDELRSGLKR